MAQAVIEEKQTEAKFTPDEVIAKQRNRQLMIMTVIIVVLSGAVWLASHGGGEESPIEEVLLVGGTRDEPAILPIDVRSIQIWKGDAKPFELSRDGDAWRVPSRFNAPADKLDVESLLSRITDAARLSRASTTTEAQYINYNLNDEDAVNVRLLGEKGETLLHFMIGRSETGARDFVRLVGEGQPAGIFELAGLGGDFDTLYAALKLDSDNQPKAARWVNTSAFEPLPFEAVVQEITLKDGDTSLTFNRKPGSDPAADEWLMTAPRKGDAEGTAVRGIVDALQNYHASDIAGRDTDAVSLGVSSGAREVTLRYSIEAEIHEVRLYFGNKNEAGEVAVWLKTKDRGGYIWWAPDFALTRMFRPAAEFMRKVRLALVPDGVNAQTLTVEDNGVITKLARDGQAATATWKLEQPVAGEVDRAAVTNLQTGLSTLQGYPVSDTTSREELGLGHGISNRVITATYPDPKSEADPKPLKTSTLYFGKTSNGEVPVMRVLDDVEVTYWVALDAIERLFQPPTSYLKLTNVGLLAASLVPADVIVRNGADVLQLTHVLGEGDQKQWRINQPWDEIADQAEVDALVRALGNLRGIKSPALDKAQYKLGAEHSARQVHVRSGEGEAAKTTQLFIGEMKDDLRSALLVKADATEEFWLIRDNDLYPLFVAPADFKVLPQFSGKVRHILISWKGNFAGVSPKDPNRTEAQARELAADILRRAQAKEDFETLQKEYNEDSDPVAVYDVSPNEGLVRPFLRLSSQLKPGEAGVVESQFGLHVIKRIE